MIFENVVPYDQAAVRVLVEVDSRVLRRKNFLLRRAVLLAVGLFAVACGSFLALLFDRMDLVTRAICVLDLILGILLLGKGIFFRRALVRRTMRGVTGGERHVTFTEEEIQVEQPGVQKAEYYYSTVAAVYETEGYFILPLSTGGKSWRPSIVLDKGGFVQGTVPEFRAFLQERTGKTAQFVHCG